MHGARFALASACLVLACGNESTPSETGETGGTTSSGGSPSGGTPGTGGASGSAQGGDAGSDMSGGTSGTSGASGTNGSGGAAGAAGTAPGGAGGTAPMWGIETRPTGQTCLPPVTPAGIATVLSATGCVDPMDHKKPAATLIPYSVSSPLWSDAAAKGRYFALPDGATIDVKNCTQNPASCMPIDMGGSYEDEGDWTFPIGTVFMKTFAFGDTLVETRLLVRGGEFDFWGYSYHWRADQSDADLWPSNVDGNDQMIDGPDGPQVWHYPSRQQCLQCHTNPTGIFLGPETSQLNTDFQYPNGVVANQLDTLEHIGIFSAPLARRPAYPSPADSAANLTERARSYMHSNCSMCHRPGSNFTGFDARFITSFADMTLCNAPPEKGDLGVMGALRITPGDPTRSLVSLRMHTRDPLTQMPQIGTNVVDTAGVGVIDDWIESLTSCP